MIEKLNDIFHANFQSFRSSIQAPIRKENDKLPIEELDCVVSDHLSLDGLLHADHGVAPPVEEDVGGGGGAGARHQLLRCGLDDAVVTVQPAGVA